MKTAPQATGWHVAGLQFVNPIGTWRLACLHANRGRWKNVTFIPASAREAYRSDSAPILTLHGEVCHG